MPATTSRTKWLAVRITDAIIASGPPTATVLSQGCLVARKTTTPRMTFQPAWKLDMAA